MARLRCRTLRVAELSPFTSEGMWGLFAQIYQDVERGRFLADLAAKDHVVLLQDPQGVRGFTTARTAIMHHEGRRFLVLYSGDTVLDPSLWGSRKLQHGFGRYMMRARLRHPGLPAYWLLVSKGYKTYLLLTRNFPEHWPRYDKPTPAWISGAIDTVCRTWFPESWQPARGLLVHPTPVGRLRKGIAGVDEVSPGNPDVAHFVRQNPDHARGDELVCLGRIGWTTWLHYALKPLRRARIKRMVEPCPS